MARWWRRRPLLIDRQRAASGGRRRKPARKKNTLQKKTPPPSTKPQSLFDCSACNLPWDLNTKVDSVDENRQILTQLRRQLKDGAPCAIVSKGTVHDDPDNNHNTPVLPWEQLGFRVLGQAQVPPKDFQLPVGKKKPRKSNAVERPVPIDQGRSHCLVTIVEAV